MRYILIFILLFLPIHAAPKKQEQRPRLSSVQIIDRNGFTETFTEKNRLDAFEKIDFKSHQPYQRVLRVHAPDPEGAVRSFLTTYFDNGQIKQYLEIKNARAYGLYQEWFPHGQLKVKSYVVGGTADITPAAQSQWLFEGPSLAYDEEGHLLAKIMYQKGVLDGVSETYSPSGKVLSKSPYKKGLLEGELQLFSDQGNLLEKHTYQKGLLHGSSQAFWKNGKIAVQEEYEEGKLISGFSFDSNGQEKEKVEDGEGFRYLMGLGELKERQEIHDGDVKGEVTVYGTNQKPINRFHVLNGEKHGLESVLYPSGKDKLTIEWSEGKIQGHVKSYYPSGARESDREWVKNKRQGLSLAWYPGGDLMLIESYEDDILEKGEYFKRGDKFPISTVEKGKGIATLYDKDGILLKKVTYEHGKPLLP